MSMFCYQCQETAGGKGCTIRGVCGKTEPVSKLHDLLIYTIKGIAYVVKKNGGQATSRTLDREMMNSLFITITNANFDDESIEKQILKMLKLRDQLIKESGVKVSHDAAVYTVDTRESMLEKAASVGFLAEENEDIRSLKQLITYGLKGMAAYAEHASNIGKESDEVYGFVYEALDEILSNDCTVDSLVALTLKTGEYGVKAMALLDNANTSRYGNPEITEVNIGVRKNPAILISGHDLTDLEQLLEQTRGTGVDVYTHSEMLPAHYYPTFKKYDNFAGNYGNAWWKQVTEFESFRGPILFTTNCIVPPKSEEVKNRIFTTGSTGYPGCRHIVADKDGKKDFSEIIALAKTLPSPEEIESGSIVGGFAHNQVAALADKVV
ncbi:MAG: hydroxylamine reductase, partial [Eubacteriales bacterium]|nr:hydroxylamine reductase [Eubacteriales bacterium]